MSEPKTAGQLIQEQLVSILNTGKVSLKVDARTPRIVEDWPGDRLSQRGCPLIVVPRLIRNQHDRNCSAYFRQVWEVPLGLIDAAGSSSAGKIECEDRLELLWERVVQYLNTPTGAAGSNWNLAYLHLHVSNCSFEPGVMQYAGNNLIMLPCSIKVPVLVEIGKVWES